MHVRNVKWLSLVGGTPYCYRSTIHGAPPSVSAWFDNHIGRWIGRGGPAKFWSYSVWFLLVGLGLKTESPDQKLEYWTGTIKLRYFASVPATCQGKVLSVFQLVEVCAKCRGLYW